MNDVLTRCAAAQLRVDELQREGADCTDLGRLRAINAELEVIRDSMLEIRWQQITASLKPERKKRWWRR